MRALVFTERQWQEVGIKAHAPLKKILLNLSSLFHPID